MKPNRTMHASDDAFRRSVQAGSGEPADPARIARPVVRRGAPPRQTWEHAIPPADRFILDAVMPICPVELGARPTLLVIDVTYGFTGSRPMPIEDAIAEYPTSCGGAAWQALPRIRALVDAFRDCELPVVWTTGDHADAGAFGSATMRGRSAGHPGNERRRDEIHEQVAPNGYGAVITKSRASAFYGTLLSAYLTRERVDSVVLVGCTTSGCVRASAVDAFSAGYRAFVAADCCFDRSAISHDVSLFDLSHKYAYVLDSDELLRQLSKPSG